MGELSPLLMWLHGWERDAPHTSHQCLTQIGERTGLEIIRAGELALPLICCSTRKSVPYPTAGRHSRAGPEGVDVDLILRS